MCEGAAMHFKKVIIMVLVVAICMLSNSFSMEQADDLRIEGYIFLIESADYYNIGYKIRCDTEYDEFDFLNFKTLLFELKKFEDSSPADVVLQVVPNIPMDHNFPTGIGGMVTLKIKHEMHDQIVKVIRSFQPQIVFKSDNGEEQIRNISLGFLEL